MSFSVYEDRFGLENSCAQRYRKGRAPRGVERAQGFSREWSGQETRGRNKLPTPAAPQSAPELTLKRRNQN